MKGHVARKRFGQNFLVDRGIINAIVSAINPARSDTVVEIGPGLGAITEPLLERLDHLHVVEIDRDLIARLKKQHPATRLSIHEGDALAFDFATIGKDLRLVGNLPYNISTPLLFHLADYASCVRDMHFMLQKEVVERMVALPGESEFSRISVMLQYRFHLEWLIDVPPESFDPAPKVQSAVVRLIPKNPAELQARSHAVFFRVVQTAFSQRRKMLRNTLKGTLDDAGFSELGIPPTCRAEDVSVADYVRIANHLTPSPWETMTRLRFAINLSYHVIGQPADFVFNIHAAPTAHQTVRSEALSINQPVKSTIHYDPIFRHRLLRLRAEPGPLKVSYEAEVDILHHVGQPEKIAEMPIAELPTEVLPYLYPSRYCESDKMQLLANQTFGHLPPGYQRVEAIRKWVNSRTKFTSGSSNFTTSAIDTYLQHAGVCRDFAHLMIALCRALNIPARFSSGIDYGADPALGPTDFHAYVEVFLGGRWYIFDPSGTAMPMGFVRIGTGRDAADISFATIFGAINSDVPVLTIEALDDPAQGFEVPRHRTEALSTDAPVGFTAKTDPVASQMPAL